MGAGEIWRILSRTQGHPELIMQDKSREEILRMFNIDPDAKPDIYVTNDE